MLNLHLPQAVGSWLNRLTGQDDAPRDDTSDTVLRWPPTPARVLASAERHAYKCITKAMALEHPKGFVLAHVPLHKLVRVPLNASYREWLSRTGLLTVDFALCDEHGSVCSVVLMPLTDEQPRQQRQLRRRERLLRVLRATDLPITLWERDWQGDDEGEPLRRVLFPKRQAAGYYADQPHAH